MGKMSFDERVALATAPGWRPEAGDKLEKVEVVRLSLGEDSGYGQYPIVTYLKDDGTYVRVHAFHTLLRERLAELKTTIGSVQNLQYIGRRTANTAKANGDVTEYELYYVENDGDSDDNTDIDEGFKF